MMKERAFVAFRPEFTFLGAGDDDNVAPIPIPASALLFPSGLVGLIGFGFRRRGGSYGSRVSGDG